MQGSVHDKDFVLILSIIGECILYSTTVIVPKWFISVFKHEVFRSKKLFSTVSSPYSPHFVGVGRRDVSGCCHF